MHRSGSKRYPGYEVERRGQFAGYRNAVAGWPLSSDLIPRQDNPDNLISTASTLFGGPIFSIARRSEYTFGRVGKGNHYLLSIFGVLRD